MDDTVKALNATASLQLRIPEWLRARITELAQENGRSLNREITQRLVQSIEDKPAKLQINETYTAILSQLDTITNLIEVKLEERDLTNRLLNVLEANAKGK